MKAKTIIAIYFLCVAVFSFTSARADLPPVKQIEEKPVIQVKEGTKGKPLYLKTMKARLDPLNKIGELQSEEN